MLSGEIALRNNHYYYYFSNYGCPPSFVSILQQFHTGMCAQVVMAGYQSASLSADVGVKQGCVLAPIIFDLFLVVAMTLVCVAVTSNHLIAVELSIVLMVISSQSILVTWVRCRFLETVIDGSNPGCISTLCLRAKHLICIASVDSAGK